MWLSSCILQILWKNIPVTKKCFLWMVEDYKPRDILTRDTMKFCRKRIKRFQNLIETRRNKMAFNDCFSLSYPGNPQPGDLIEVFRSGYQHWALYLGDGYVINIAPLEDGIPAAFTSAKSIFSRKALVKMQPLKDVVGNDTYRINNKYDETYPPLPMEEVMQRSEIVIGQEVDYDILVNNCEHFVTLLRYGEGVSEQANQAISTIGFVTAAAGVFSLLGLFPKRQRAKYY